MELVTNDRTPRLRDPLRGVHRLSVVMGVQDDSSSRAGRATLAEDYGRPARRRVEKAAFDPPLGEHRDEMPRISPNVERVAGEVADRDKLRELANDFDIVTRAIR